MIRRLNTALFTLIALLQAGATLLSPATLRSQEHVIKFATLAPEGSTWMNVMKEYDAAVRAESGGRLGFRIYPSGVQGDERDVLRKIKLGQLQSAGITGNGLTVIAPSARILDSPFLFHDTSEIDCVYSTFGPEIEAALEESGFITLGWAEVGDVYIFTNIPIRKKEDLSKTKMWMWEGDPIAEAAFRALGVTPIPLTITDVLTSLQTNLIDGVYTSPLAAIALQWFTRVKYMLDLPLANATGAVVMSQKKFLDLPEDLRIILRKNGRKYMRRLTELSRADNR
ncbi:MAG TPA: TRAP transporter substrate-binding protein DctP, partial [Bacteroidota bacterium]|nr:TRAP transporter substrate-binding protein DctP [Bacteroidota bacterium]